MAAAPRFVQFSVINRRTLGQASAAPALAPRKTRSPILNGACL
jgi:hypothetical protein